MPTTSELNITQNTTGSETFSLETEFRTALSDTGLLTTEIWANTDKDAESQVETITIAPTLPTVDALYRVKVEGPTVSQEFSYVYLTSSSATASTIAAFFAQVIDTHPEVSAKNATNTAVITSVVPGTNGSVTYTVSCSELSNNSAIASKITATQTTAASGTGKLRKLMAVQLEMGSTLSAGKAKPQLNVRAAKTFDGSQAAVQLGDWGSNPYSHALTWDQLVAVS